MKIGNKIQLLRTIRINNGQFYFYGEYDPQTHQLVPLDSMDVILFPSDEVEAIIMQEIKEMYSTILKVDKAMLDFSKEAISLLTERSHDLIYPPLPEFSTNT